MTRFFQNLTYVLLQIILLPISLIGMIYANYKQQKNSKKENISYTAGQVIQGQWILHYFNIRNHLFLLRKRPLNLQQQQQLNLQAAINSLCSFSNATNNESQ